MTFSTGFIGNPDDAEVRPYSLMGMFDRLFPINRSITGNGVRESLRILGEAVPIRQREFPSGLECFDWTIPNEWNVKEAYIKDSAGRTIVDFRNHNLHLVGYSVPVRGTFSREELLQHIHTTPHQPRAIPYITSYYRETWGFCMEHERLAELTDDRYEVVIDATLEPGSLTIGEGFIEGESDREILFSTYVCHPSMAINELSGPLVQTEIYRQLLRLPRPYYSYRFLYIPETIGSIVYLHQHGRELMSRMQAGYVVTCVGHGESYTYKRTRHGDTIADKAALHVLRSAGKPHKVIDWSVLGSDERQYGSQGFRLPVGSLMRTMYTEYPEYHTSLDNRDLISETVMQETANTYVDIAKTLQANAAYQSAVIYCEPKMDKRGLYPTLGGPRKEQQREQLKVLMSLLAFSDGELDLIGIAEKLKLPALDLAPTAKMLEEKGLLIRVGASDKDAPTRFGTAADEL